MKKFLYTLLGLLLFWGFGHAQVLSEVNFSVQRGLYTNPFYLELSSDDPVAQIYYTLDGSEPSSANGFNYAQYVDIQSTALVRAIAYTATDTSDISTHSYIFPEDIFDQQGIPAGYPALWSELSPDYDVDTLVTNDAYYKDMIRESFEDFPVVSLVLDKEHLFNDSTGIYQNPREEGVEWERATSVEMIHFSGQEGFQEDAGLRISGGSTRRPEYFKKHAFRLLFKSQYGASKLKYPLFGDEGAEEFNTFVLRMIGHFSMHDWNAYRREKMQLGKDQFARELQKKMGQPYIRGEFVHLFLNGMYWGIYNLTERPDAAYMASYFGGGRADYDAINSLKIVDGDSIAWYEMHDLAQAGLSSDSAYAAIEEYLDIDNFFDYMTLNHWGINTDWDNHNWYAARKREPGGQFKFFSWDAEFMLGYFNYTEFVYDSGAGDYSYPRFLFHTLMENEKARSRFADRVQCTCRSKGPLTGLVAPNHYTNLAASIEGMSIAETARWGDVSGTLYSYNSYIAPESIDLIDSKLPARGEELINLYKNRGVFPVLEGVQYSKYSGQLTVSEEVSLYNPNAYGEIYYTIDGTDPRNEDGNMSSSALLYDAPLALPDGVTDVKARVFNDDDQQWSAMCPQRFHRQQDMSGIVINEIHYNPDSLCSTTQAGELDYLELTNAGYSQLDLTDCQFTKGIRYKFPYKTILDPGDFYVIAENLDSFTVHYGFEPDGQYLDALDNGGDVLILKDPFNNVLDSLVYNDKNPWDTAPDGVGMSLELVNTDWDNAEPTNWFRSDMSCDGTPGAANTRDCAGLTEEIIINEINYNSDAETDPGDWVELYNPMEDSVKLSGWQFFDEKNSFTFSEDISIAPNEYLVLVEDSLMFSSIFPSIENYMGSFNFNLSGGGERISLLANGNCLADYVIYDDNMPWDTIADGSGATLSLTNSFSDNNQAQVWEASSHIGAPMGTPGRPNQPCPIPASIIIPELCAAESIVVTLDTIYEDMEHEWLFWNASQDTTAGDTITVLWDEPGSSSVQLVSRYRECTNIAFLPLEISICNTAPLAVNDTITTLEDIAAPINILSNDSDADQDSLSVYIISPPESGTLELSGNGIYTYTPENNQFGVFDFTYQICDDASYMLCDTAVVTIQIEEVEEAPVALNDLYTIEEDSLISGNVLDNDYEPDGDSIIVSQNLLVSVTNGLLTLNADGSFQYTPAPNFNGQDNFMYEICGGGLCSTAEVYIEVLAMNDAPVALSDTFYMYNDSVLQYSILNNYSDIDEDELSVSLLQDIPTGEPGLLNLSSSGDLVYVPPSDYVGTQVYTYQVCDDGMPMKCAEAELVFIIEAFCIDIELYAFLEGPYNSSTGFMETTLNTMRGMLPGQTPLSNLSTPTPAGQPYHQVPWDYDGDEGLNFTDTSYDPSVVDWVLLSFRTGIESNTTVATVAALMHDNGYIELLDNCLFTRSSYEPVYVVIEHRNHIGIMSPSPISLDGERLYFNFTLQNTYKDPTSNGQKELGPEAWAMFGADGEQISDIISYDINGMDKSFWFDYNGIFDVYLPTDYNLDGDVNGADKAIWYLNNGVSSRVPK